MAKFLIYLFESGLCLTLFYLGYVFFFRKETYFTFNRIYLIASMLLALTMPLVPVQFKVNDADILTDTMQKLGQFRNYYEELILITDPEFAVSHESIRTETINTSETVNQGMISTRPDSFLAGFNFSRILFYIYTGGLLFFIIRLLLLLYNLYRIIKQNESVKHSGYTIVLINDEIPSFSFLKWVFVNKEALKPEEFEQVLTHEKVHVDHKHSVDLILAQIITMFQWFNPLTWRIQKSLKTCHEYIADRQVINAGHELFDYQSLLLSQLISIRSVELVNNFNLLSIKKRIAMMNKIKSGPKAKLKALLIIPLLLIAFFFFAEMTGISLKSSANNNDQKFSELSIVEQDNIVAPTAKSVRVFDKDYVLFTINLSKSHLTVNGKNENINKLNDVIQRLDLPKDKNKLCKMFVLLDVDKAVEMEQVDKVKSALRHNKMLKLGYLAQADKSSGIEGGETALFNLLPPKDAKIVVPEELDKCGISLLTIKHSSYPSKQELARRIRKHVLGKSKYVLLYEYSNQSSYNDYLATIDIVHATIWDIRKEYATSEGMDYNSLTKDEEMKLRKKYPITLSMKNVDNE